MRTSGKRVSAEHSFTRIQVCAVVTGFLFAIAAVPAHGKRVVCIDGCGTPYVNSHEGYERARAKGRPPGDQFIVGGSLTDCLKNLASNDELVIVAHGTKEETNGVVHTGFMYDGKKYSGFGSGEGLVGVPDNFKDLQNINVHFCSCYSAYDPDGDEKPVVARIVEAMGGAGRGHVPQGFVNKACSATYYQIRKGTKFDPDEEVELREAVQDSLKDDRSWLEKPPPNRPGSAAMNQQAAAQAIVDRIVGADNVVISIPDQVGDSTMGGYDTPQDKVQCPGEASGGCSCTPESGCGFSAGLTAPICVRTALDAGPPTRLEITTLDVDGGLCEIRVRRSVNATVVVPSFLPETTERVVVTATKIDQQQSSSVEMEVVDCTGKATICDPVISLVVRDPGRPVQETIPGLPAAESRITIYNGTPGLKNLLITVNGVRFRVTPLSDGKEHTLDVSAAMLPGSQNLITLTAEGKPGGSATVVVHD